MYQKIPIERKKCPQIKTFYFNKEKATLQKFTPHPEDGRGVTLKFQMGTSIFNCRFGFII